MKSDGTPYVKMKPNGEPTNKPTLVKDTVGDFIDNYGLPQDATTKDMTTFKRVMGIGMLMRGVGVDELELEDADYETLMMVCRKMQHIKVACVVVQVMDVLNKAPKVVKDKQKLRKRKKKIKLPKTEEK